MNKQVLAAIIDQLGVQPRAFLAGWMEGRLRYQSSADGSVIAGSYFPRGSIGHAASDAAVAFLAALDAD